MFQKSFEHHVSTQNDFNFEARSDFRFADAFILWYSNDSWEMRQQRDPEEFTQKGSYPVYMTGMLLTKARTEISCPL